MFASSETSTKSHRCDFKQWTIEQHNFSGGNGLPSNTNLAETQNKNRMSNKAIKNRQAVKRCRQKKEKLFKNLQTLVSNLKMKIFVLETKLRKAKRKKKNRQQVRMPNNVSMPRNVGISSNASMSTNANAPSDAKTSNLYCCSLTNDLLNSPTLEVPGDALIPDSAKVPMNTNLDSEIEGPRF